MWLSNYICCVTNVTETNNNKENNYLKKHKKRAYREVKELIRQTATVQQTERQAIFSPSKYLD